MAAMNKTVILIDGYNVYHALDQQPEWHKYKWLDFVKLVSLFLSTNDVISGVYYFTALATWLPDKMTRHKILIKALELRGATIVYGNFKGKDRYCPNCKTWYEEKRTDVNIAIHLYRLAIEDIFDTAMIVSADSDLVPAIQAFKRTFPAKRVGVLFPFGRSSFELKNECDFHRKIKRNHLNQSIFPDEIDLGNGQKLVRPTTWT